MKLLIRYTNTNTTFIGSYDDCMWMLREAASNQIDCSGDVARIISIELEKS